jgi:hypothetical protein
MKFQCRDAPKANAKNTHKIRKMTPSPRLRKKAEEMKTTEREARTTHTHAQSFKSLKSTHLLQHFVDVDLVSLRALLRLLLLAAFLQRLLLHFRLHWLLLSPGLPSLLMSFNCLRRHSHRNREKRNPKAKTQYTTTQRKTQNCKKTALKI